MKLLAGERILWDGAMLEGHALLFDDRVLACLPADRTDGIEAERVEAGGRYVLPGFVNVHVHGAMGYDAMDATDEALDALSLAMAKEGVTAFLPTSVTAPMGEIDATVRAVRRGMARTLPGAAILGMHLEGPWIDEAMRGAHPAAFINRSPDIPWVAERADVLRIVTFWPTLDPEHSFTRSLKALGIVPSLGHTTADFDLALSAVRAGARSITHLFNAQRGLHHRRPGMVGAAAVSDAMCEFIADGRHVVPELFEPICRLIGTDRLILITDSMRAAGLPDGDYRFAGGVVTVRDGLPVNGDGTIAGSVLTMNRALKNFHQATRRPLSELSATVSRNPARLLGLTRKGELTAGMDADIVCLDDDFNVRATFVEGRQVFGAFGA